jgi:hypothetical protein
LEKAAAYSRHGSRGRRVCLRSALAEPGEDEGEATEMVWKIAIGTIFLFFAVRMSHDAYRVLRRRTRVSWFRKAPSSLTRQQAYLTGAVLIIGALFLFWLAVRIFMGL